MGVVPLERRGSRIRLHFCDQIVDVTPRVASDLADTLRSLLPGCRYLRADRDITQNDAPTVTVEVQETSHGLLVRDHDGQPLEEPQEEPIGAAFLVIEAMMNAVQRSAGDLLVLHAGGLETERGLIAFAGATHAGKSSLGLHFTAQGRRIFGDDRIFVDIAGRGGEPEAIALGLAQKIREPLPKSFSDNIHAHLAARSGMRYWENHFLAWSADGQAVNGTRAPLRAVLLLERDAEAGPARFTPLSRVEATQALVALASDLAGSREMLAKIVRLADHVPLFRVSYTDSPAGAEAILHWADTP